MAAPSPGTSTPTNPSSALPCSPRPPSSPAATASWNFQDDKLFESALSLYSHDAKDLWEKVAAMVPSKDVGEVERHFAKLAGDVKSIEAGLIDLPTYVPLSVSAPENGVDQGVNACNSHVVKKEVSSAHSQPSAFAVTSSNFKAGNEVTSGKTILGKPSEHERRKGIPWTEDEHRLFLLGLEKFGKGDWRSISRNFVISRTPTQVASHAQKYFIRLASMNKEKKRNSIHDITSVKNGDVRPQSFPPITSQVQIVNGPVIGQPVHHVPQHNSPGPGIYMAPVGQPIALPAGSAVGTPVLLPPQGHALPLAVVPQLPKPAMTDPARPVLQSAQVACQPMPQPAATD